MRLSRTWSETILGEEMSRTWSETNLAWNLGLASPSAWMRYLGLTSTSAWARRNRDVRFWWGQSLGTEEDDGGSVEIQIQIW